MLINYFAFFKKNNCLQCFKRYSRNLLTSSILVLFGMLVLSEKAVALDVDIETSMEKGGYGRLIITFKGQNLLPKYSTKQSNGVLVLSFSSQMNLTSSLIQKTVPLGQFISVARIDPDLKGLRFALTENTRVNIKEAGERLFVDFLPPNWSGLPPGLPADVIAALAKRAEEALRIIRAAEENRKEGEVDPELVLSVGRLPTFSRFAFTWNVPFETSFRRDKGALVISFNHVVDVDISPILADLPSFVRDVKVIRNEGFLIFKLTINPRADVRAFEEDRSYYVDISTKEALKLDNELSRILSGSSSPAQLQQQNNAIISRGMDGRKIVSVEPVLMPDSSRQAMQTMPSAGDANVSVVRSRSGMSDRETSTSTQDMIIGELPDNSDTKIPKVNSEATDIVVTKEKDNNIRVEANKFGRTVRLYFPFSKPTPAAAFRRGGSVWALFDTDRVLNLKSVKATLGTSATDVRSHKIGSAQAMEILFRTPSLTTFSSEGDGWILTIGEVMLEPTQPLSSERTILPDGRHALRIPFADAEKVHRFTDPTVGDSLIVVTALGAPQGFIKPQAFVEFQQLVSALGIAVAPRVDDLIVQKDGTDILITRKSGLTVSSSGAGELSGGLSNGATFGRPGFISFKELQTENPAEYYREKQILTHDLALSDESQRIAKLLALAKFNLTHRYANEALGQLKIIEQDAPQLATTADFRILRGAAETLARRSTEALKRLSENDLLEFPDAAVWRALAAGDIEDWPAVQMSALRARSVINDYPPFVQTELSLGATRAALESQDYGTAASYLSEIEPSFLTVEQGARYDILRGLLADARGKSDIALTYFARAAQADAGPVAAEGKLLDIRTSYREGLIERQVVVDRLEGLTTLWRGDETERLALRMLAHVYVEDGRYRDAFLAMKSSVMSDAESDTTRILQDEMNAVFRSLFLDNKANQLPPVKALSLYYDFRELTPIGRQGDEMVRRLADRLVSVDLLDQAQELLAHQVDNRLAGAARAQVAADLALVYLLDGKPQRALNALRKTRQTRLPKILDRQRRVVEARALAEIGKAETAAALLKNLDGPDIERLRADIYWQARDWSKAAEQLEFNLAGRWSDGPELNDSEQISVLRAAIGYTLADDVLGLDRLRNKYAAKMSNSPLANAFDTVSQPIKSSSVEFQAVARDIANTDTLDGFLKEYRARYLDVDTRDEDDSTS